MQVSDQHTQQLLMTATLKNGQLEFYTSDQYDEYMIPPNQTIAEQHQLACKVGIPKPYKEGETVNICPCCKQQIEKTQIDFQRDEMAFSFLGSGYPLYFNFIKCCLMIVGVLFLTSGQYQLVSNLTSNDCEDLVVQVQHRYKEVQKEDSWSEQVHNYCLNDWIARSSLANKRFQSILTELPHYFNFSSVIFILIIIFFFRKSQLIIDNDCDIKENTPSDYTLIVKDIPKDCKQQQLKEFFENKFNVEVMEVDYIFFANTLKELEQQLEVIVKQQKIALENNDNDQLINLNEQKKLKQNQITTEALRIQQDFELFSGTAFLSLKYEDHKQAILKSSNYRTQQVISNIFFGCIIQEAKSLEINNQFIKVDQAPEPGDVIWDNIVHNDNRRFWVRLLGFTFSQIVIALFLITLLELAKIQAQDASNVPATLVDVQTDQGIVQVSLPSQQKSKNMGSIIAALLTTFINSFVVGRLSNFLVGFESYETYSLYTVSLASKLSLMLFVNSAIIAFLASTIYTRNLFGPGGLIYTETYFFITNAIIPPLVTFIDPNRITKSLKLWWIKKFNKAVTQKELNELNEHTEHMIELKYADIMKTLFITFFYTPLTPAGYITSFIGLALYYVAEKYVICYRMSVKHTPSVQLSILMTEMMEYLPIIYAAGYLIFNYQITGSTSYWAIASILVSFLSSVLPMQYFVESCFKQEEQDETTSYNEAKVNFSTTYSLQNPVNKYNKQEQIIQGQLKSKSQSQL
ncbi:unnamed protein product [Paramecium pentaurelia]|uniref:CSC1/OSCA1-like cytosolic domain-containing protein n=1 Tax=Paramecium pentaurelia TaxID=43138 RepID=A0A8S1U1K8_9CILI|nr:unnamed protein product [Paramecium pentaurelia]